MTASCCGASTPPGPLSQTGSNTYCAPSTPPLHCKQVWSGEQVAGWPRPRTTAAAAHIAAPLFPIPGGISRHESFPCFQNRPSDGVGHPAPAPAAGLPDRAGRRRGGRRVNTTRFATFNASLNRFNEGDLVSDLSTPDNAQAQTIAEIIQRTRPEVLLINEFDYDANGEAAMLFRDNYLSVSQNGADPIDYPYYYVAPSNTGNPVRP